MIKSSSVIEDVRGFLLARQEDWEGAIEAFEKALAGGASSPGLHRRLSRLYELSGDPGGALAHERKAKDLEVTTP